MSKKLFATVLALTLLCTGVFTIFAGSFTDIPADAYYAAAAERMAARGILSGYGNERYYGNESVTRAHIAALACKMLGKVEEATALAGATAFTDVPETSWATGYVNYAHANGIILGDGDGKFRPDDYVKYEEVVKVILCVLELDDGIKTDPTDWSKGYLERAEKAGLLTNLIGKKGTYMLRSDIAVITDAAMTLLDKSAATAAVTTTTAVSEGPGPDLILFDQNTSYLIIHAEETTQTIINLVADLHKAIDDMTDIHTVTIKTDRIQEGAEPDANALEILIANTNRPESAEAMQDLAYSDFAIKKIGNKVVIAAHNEKTLKEAVDYFRNNLLIAEGEGTNKVIKLKNEYVSNSGVADIITSPEQLGEYQIVYPTGNVSMMICAKDLAAKLEAYCGVPVKCVYDRTAASDKEILVGMTSREESAAIQEMSGLDYTIKVVGQKIVIGGYAQAATNIALDTFASDFLSGIYSSTFRISGNYDNSATGMITLEDAYDPTRTEGADLRIMSFNILAELWDAKAKATMPGRDKLTVSLILSYMPDVVGLQETTALWYSLLEPQLDGIYKFASHKVPNGKVNYSTIMYNIHTTELIECNTTMYSVRNSDNMRHLTWARFRRKSDGAEYIVSCTHWDITHEKRLVQWEENANLINDLYAKYKLPIFATGDYNSNEEDLFAKFIEKTGMEDPKYVAKTIVNAGKTYHALGSKPANTELCIDHIAVTPGQDILFYNRLTCPTALDASDHSPIYIDVKLNK